MKYILIITLFLFIIAGQGQTTLKGKVTDKKGEPVAGANVYIKGSFDGASTGGDGQYQFTTGLTGKQILMVSCIGFETMEKELELSGTALEISAVLKESRNELDAVVITAGTFEASDEKKAVILRPLDIVTTAGGLADIAGALNTLPGTQTVGEQGKLFVRGGDSRETGTWIDGMLADQPYQSTLPDIPARGRFSPFQFSGTVFSTGGYSAEYGQALSSALILNTDDFPDEEAVSLSLMSLGVGGTVTKKWKNTALTGGADYYNLSPYYHLFKQDFDWKDYPEAASGSVSFRHRPGKNSLIKSFATFSRDFSSIRYPDYDQAGASSLISLMNDNLFAYSTYQDIYNEKLVSKTGAAFAYNLDEMETGSDKGDRKTYTFQLRQSCTYLAGKNVNIRFGGEILQKEYTEGYYMATDESRLERSLSDPLPAAFAESEVSLSNNFAARVGGRFEYSGLLNRAGLTPRVSLAYKTGKDSQVSLAWGVFCQKPAEEYIFEKKSLDFERAGHYILNYQLMKNNRVLRVEGYLKSYSRLVTFSRTAEGGITGLTNNGKGYARGFDVFWRDKSYPNCDYWISYSFLDSERKYHDYPAYAVPTFVSKHNASLVFKYYVGKLSTYTGFTYTFASGRTYYNPNSADFLSDKTGCYHDLSFNASYLTSLWKAFTIVYVSVSNLPGFKNVYGYHFSNVPEPDGTYKSYAIKPGSKRFWFFGVFITI
jgi:hypothetical protein